MIEIYSYNKEKNTLYIIDMLLLIYHLSEQRLENWKMSIVYHNAPK